MIKNNNCGRPRLNLSKEDLEARRKKHSRKVSENYRFYRNQRNLKFKNFMLELFVDLDKVKNLLNNENLSTSNMKFKAKMFDIIYLNRNHLFERTENMIELLKLLENS